MWPKLTHTEYLQVCQLNSASCCLPHVPAFATSQVHNWLCDFFSMECTLLFVSLIFVIYGCYSSYGQQIQRRRLSNTHRRLKPLKVKDPNRGNGNERADAALSFVESVFLGEEPVEVRDLPRPCATCMFHGITQMTRKGPVTLMDVDEDRRRIKITLAFASINVTCDCVFCYVISGKADIKIRNFIIHMDVVVNYEVEDTEVRTIKVLDTGKVEFQFDGYGILGNIVDKFLWLFQGTLNKVVCDQIQQVMPRVLREEKRQRLYHLGLI